MKSPPDPARSSQLERSFFFILLALLTVAFAAVLWPFYGAVFWGSVLALMFQPLYRRLLGRMRGRQNLAALATLGDHPADRDPAADAGRASRWCRR